MMTRKEVRAIVLSMTIGDGCLCAVKQIRREGGIGSNQFEQKPNPLSGRTVLYGKFAMEHGIKQQDYFLWKVELLRQCFPGRKITARISKGGSAIQCGFMDKRLRSWRKFIYRNGVKDKFRILPYLDNPWFSLALWLCDDGYSEKHGQFRLFGCSYREQGLEKMLSWFGSSFSVKPRIKLQKNAKRGKTYPFLVFNWEDTEAIWSRIRADVLRFPSMTYKFRHTESRYQRTKAQHPPPCYEHGDDIVHATAN